MNRGREPAKIALGLLKLTVPSQGHGAHVERQTGAAAEVSTTIQSESYTPDELWRLTCLIGEQNEDIIAPAAEDVLRPVFHSLRRRAIPHSRRRCHPRH